MGAISILMIIVGIAFIIMNRKEDKIKYGKYIGIAILIIGIVVFVASPQFQNGFSQGLKDALNK